MKKNKSKGKDSENIKNNEPEDECSPTASFDNEDESNDQNKSIEKRQFEFIKGLKDFKDLMKKENKIIKDFHGIHDFYN